MAYHSKEILKNRTIKPQELESQMMPLQRGSSISVEECAIVKLVVLGSVFKLLLLQIYFARVLCWLPGTGQH